MRSQWRWAIVGVGVAVLALMPAALARLPAGHSSISAAELLTRIRNSASVDFSGYAEATGSLALPVTADRFGSLNDLFGGTSDLRVWWRGSADYRVDTIGPVGESDLHHDATGDWTFDYESNTATHVAAPLAPLSGAVPFVRLPRADDLVPPMLARRLLAQATSAQLTRLGDVRIAGRDAAGLRLTTNDPRSTIAHVDVWALPSSGLPLQVKVFGRSSGTPVLRTSLLDVSTATPAASVTAFDPAAGVHLSSDDAPDLVSAIERFGQGQAPARLAGLPGRPDLGSGPVGVYGQGVTIMVAVPLPGRVADSLAAQLSNVVGVVDRPTGLTFGVGPLELLLGPATDGDGRWLLAGTVTTATLRTAGAQLPAVPGFGFSR
ncbi:MAG: transcriptional regulator [Jatrophihabitantaceae bacterium]